VRVIAEGKKRVTIEARGVARMVERTDPIAVKLACKSAAEKSARRVPVRIFQYNPTSTSSKNSHKIPTSNMTPGIL
jgi:hypothetical protein